MRAILFVCLKPDREKGRRVVSDSHGPGVLSLWELRIHRVWSFCHLGQKVAQGILLRWIQISLIRVSYSVKSSPPPEHTGALWDLKKRWGWNRWVHWTYSLVLCCQGMKFKMEFKISLALETKYCLQHFLLHLAVCKRYTARYGEKAIAEKSPIAGSLREKRNSRPSVELRAESKPLFILNRIGMKKGGINSSIQAPDGARRSKWPRRLQRMPVLNPLLFLEAGRHCVPRLHPSGKTARGTQPQSLFKWKNPPRDKKECYTTVKF